MDRRSFIAGLGAALLAPAFDPHRVYSFPSWPPKGNVDLFVGPPLFTVEDCRRLVKQFHLENLPPPAPGYVLTDTHFDREAGIFRVNIRLNPRVDFIELDYP